MFGHTHGVLNVDKIKNQLRQKREKLHPFPFDIPMPPHGGRWGRQKALEKQKDPQVRFYYNYLKCVWKK